MWLTPLSSKGQNTATNLCKTSTLLTHTSSSPRRLLTLRVPFPFLDTLVSPGPDNTLLTTVNRNPPTLTTTYMWTTTTICQLSSLFNTLTHRARTVCTTLQLLQEEEHTRKAYQGVNTPCGCSVDWRLGTALNTATNRANPGPRTTKPASTTPTTATTTSTWWFLIPRVSSNLLRTSTIR